MLRVILEFSIADALQFVGTLKDDPASIKAIQDLGAKLVGPTEELRATLERVVVPPPPTTPPLSPPGGAKS